MSDNEVGRISWDPTFLKPYKRAGWWIMPGSESGYQTKFTANRRPRWLTRFLMWHLLEWKWEDDKLD